MTQALQISGEAMGGMALRLNMLMTHYRKPLNFTQHRFAEADKLYRKWLSIAEHTGEHPGVEFLEALCDDMNTPQAIAIMHGYAKRRERGKLFAAMQMLGLLPQTVQVALQDLDGGKTIPAEQKAAIRLPHTNAESH